MFVTVVAPKTAKNCAVPIETEGVAARASGPLNKTAAPATSATTSPTVLARWNSPCFRDPEPVLAVRLNPKAIIRFWYPANDRLRPTGFIGASSCPVGMSFFGHVWRDLGEAK